VELLWKPSQVLIVQAKIKELNQKIDMLRDTMTNTQSENKFLDDYEFIESQSGYGYIKK